MVMWATGQLRAAPVGLFKKVWVVHGEQGESQEDTSGQRGRASDEHFPREAVGVRRRVLARLCLSAWLPRSVAKESSGGSGTL